jgi:hypothetical protein
MRQWRHLLLLAAVLLVALLPQAALGDAPPEVAANDTMGKAVVIDDPAKTQSVYGELGEAGEFQYYRFEIKKDERILVNLIRSPADADFIPNMALLGPGLPRQDAISESIKVPERLGWRVVQGKQPLESTYDGFSPGSFYNMAEIDTAAPEDGNYYIVVFSGTGGGRYGLSMGYQGTFDVAEWLTLPYNAFSTHRWQGQNWAFILGPVLTPLAIGGAWFWWRRRNDKKKTPRTYFEWAAGLAGLLFGASAISFAVQTGLAVSSSHLTWQVGVSVIFIIIPAVLSYVTLRTALRRRRVASISTRSIIFFMGVFAFIFWAGWLVGPALAIVATFLPHRPAFSYVQSGRFSSFNQAPPRYSRAEPPSRRLRKP